ncbi:MAG: 50S ribosomal protein L9 [Mycoplasmataceae bacterium]|nr:MAG: 50S ribosomal protein L9 [Mycoplasmataceae bacterium]
MKKLEKVIFLNKEKWGDKFEIKELRRGFVINYLLLRNKVLLANEKNLLWLKEQESQKLQADLVLEEEVQKMYDKVNNFSLSFILKKDDKGHPFGSVSFKEILDELAKSNFLFEKNQLLDFHPLNKLGENVVKLKLSNKVIADLKIKIE